MLVSRWGSDSAETNIVIDILKNILHYVHTYLQNAELNAYSVAREMQ